MKIMATKTWHSQVNKYLLKCNSCFYQAFSVLDIAPESLYWENVLSSKQSYKEGCFYQLGCFKVASNNILFEKKEAKKWF